MLRDIDYHRKGNMQHIRRAVETLTNKFKPQYNQTIKSLQFRKPYRYGDENVEE